MKNYLMFALLIGATASMAFGQFGVVVDPAKVEIACPDDECHVAPFFKGEGGFIGEIADGFDEVNFVVDCGIVKTTASAEASDGVVAQLLNMGNGLGCASGGSVEIHGLKDGGWYWITDEMNSAVASLMAKDVLGNDPVMPADPGSSDITLESMEGAATSIVKQVSTGRIGILHHVLPQPMMEMEAADLCGPYWDGDDRTFYNDTTNCMLGSGATKIVMNGPGRNGRNTRLSGSVERNVALAGPVTVSFALWSDGSGHVIGGSGSSTLVGHDITLPASLRPYFTVNPFGADFGVEIISPSSTSETEAGITVLKDGDVLSEMPSVSVVPGTPDRSTDATSPTGSAGLQDDNLGADADGNAIPEITNGWGMFEGEPTYCRQATSRNADGDLLLHFATSAGGVVMLEPDPDGTGSLSALAADASWSAQLTWAQAWNGDNTDSSKFISILTMDLNDPATPEVAADDTRVPEVVCATTMGDPRMVRGTGGVEIDPTSPLCNDRTSQTVRLRITAPLGAARSLNDSTPPIAWGGRVGGVHVAAHTTLDVLCPAASASTSRGLVPDNPFPVD